MEAQASPSRNGAVGRSAAVSQTSRSAFVVRGALPGTMFVNYWWAGVYLKRGGSVVDCGGRTPLWLHRGTFQRSFTLPPCRESGNMSPQSKRRLRSPRRARFLGHQSKTLLVLLQSAAGLRHSRAPFNCLVPLRCRDVSFPLTRAFSPAEREQRSAPGRRSARAVHRAGLSKAELKVKT